MPAACAYETPSDAEAGGRQESARAASLIALSHDEPSAGAHAQNLQVAVTKRGGRRKHGRGMCGGTPATP